LENRCEGFFDTFRLPTVVSERHREAFGRPVYGGLRELFADWGAQRGRMRKLRSDAERGLVDQDLRKRLMLAVTSVNRCRWCSWAHARGALKQGIPEGQVDELLCGTVDDCPEEELAALLYAIHWAETDGHPDAEARHAVVERYGAERTDAIDRALATIRAGNLLGNSFDYVFFRLSGGRLGTKAHVPMRDLGQVREMPSGD
jgi:AhpD family alkylhydroperoxidase